MKWPELEYFFSFLKWGHILDIWCGNGRLLELYTMYFGNAPEKYTWIDMSSWLIAEALKIFPGRDFREGDMLDIWGIIVGQKFKNVFLIASFHHLSNIQEREDMMWLLYDVLEDGWYIYMTNWALESSLNKEKYRNSQIPESKNRFMSSDFNIKIWKFERFYHSFHLDELSYLADKVGFKIQENRLFEWEKNIITILQK